MSFFYLFRNAATGGATPSAILGAAMGIPGANAPASRKYTNIYFKEVFLCCFTDCMGIGF